MARRIQAFDGVENLALPGGWHLDEGDEVVIPDEEWEQITDQEDLLLYLVDLGETTDFPDPVPSFRDMQRTTAGGSEGLAAQVEALEVFLSAHLADTTDVHGIIDTANLAPNDMPDLTLIYENGLL